jgi:hypothetical protein
VKHHPVFSAFFIECPVPTGLHPPDFSAFSFNKFNLERQRREAITLACTEILLASFIVTGEGETIHRLKTGITEL